MNKEGSELVGDSVGTTEKTQKVCIHAREWKYQNSNMSESGVIHVSRPPEASCI